MPRNFGTRFHRSIAGPFAGDAVPGAAQVVNNPVTGVGTLFRMSPVRLDERRVPTRLWQGYFTTVGFAGTLTLQLWVNSALGTTPGDWIQFGTALTLVSALRLFEANGQVMDGDVYVQVTPSVALIGGESLELYMEEAD